jgi:preprotein translocase subunit SecG
LADTVSLAATRRDVAISARSLGLSLLLALAIGCQAEPPPVAPTTPTTPPSAQPAIARYLAEESRLLEPLLLEVLQFATYAGNEPAHAAQKQWLARVAAELGFAARDDGQVFEIELPGPPGAEVLGLSGAFGSASGSGQTAFGAKTGDALTIFTIVMYVVFVLGGIGMKFITTPSQPPAQPALTSGSSGAGATAPSGAQGEGAVPAPAPAPEPGAASGEPEAPADPAGQPDPAGDGGDGGGEPGGL